MQNSSAICNRSLTGTLVFLRVRNPREGYCYIHALTTGLSAGILILGRSRPAALPVSGNWFDWSPLGTGFYAMKDY
jgi:hypothetical protein